MTEERRKKKLEIYLGWKDGRQKEVYFNTGNNNIMFLGNRHTS
jgi:hypothetical protein